MARVKDLTPALSRWKATSPSPGPGQPAPPASANPLQRQNADAFTCLVYGLLAGMLLSQFVFLLVWEFWTG